MTLKKLSIIVVVLVLVSSVIAACGDEVTTPSTAVQTTATSTGGTGSTNTSAAPTEARVLTFSSHVPPPVGSVARAEAAWAHWIEVASKGTLKIEFYYGGSLIPAGDELESVGNGLADMSVCYSDFLQGLLKGNDVCTLPWMCGWPGALQTTLTHLDLFNKYPELQNEIQGVKVLGMVYGPPVQIQTTKNPVKTMDDLKGQTLIQVGQYAAEAMKALGATPLTLTPAEEYDALSKGVAEGITLGFYGTNAFNYIDLINYSTQLSLVNPGCDFIIMNQAVYDSLTDEQKALFSGENAIRRAKVYAYAFDVGDREGRDAMNDKLAKAGLEPVYELPADELAKWKELTSGIAGGWISKANAAGLPGQQIYDDAVAGMAKYASWDQLAAEAESILQEWEQAK